VRVGLLWLSYVGEGSESASSWRTSSDKFSSTISDLVCLIYFFQKSGNKGQAQYLYRYIWTCTVSMSAQIVAFKTWDTQRHDQGSLALCAQALNLRTNLNNKINANIIKNFFSSPHTEQIVLSFNVGIILQRFP
jgi:hypothetical protein